MGLIKQVLLRKEKQKKLLQENRRVFKEMKKNKKMHIADELERLNGFKIADGVYVARQIRKVKPRRGAADAIFSDEDDEFFYDNNDDEYLSTDDENIEDEKEPSGEFVELIDRYKGFRSGEKKYENRMLYGKLAIRAFNYKEVTMVKPHDEFEFTMKKILKKVMWMPRLEYPAAEKRTIDVLEEKEEATPQSNKRLRMMDDEKPPVITASKFNVHRRSNNTKTSRTTKLGRQVRQRKLSANKSESNRVHMLFNPFKPFAHQFESTFERPLTQVLSPPVDAHLNKEFKGNLPDTKLLKEVNQVPHFQNQVSSGAPIDFARPFQQITSETTVEPVRNLMIPSSNGLTFYSIRKQYNDMKQEFLEYDQAEKEKFVKLAMSKELEDLSFTELLTKNINDKQEAFSAFGLSWIRPSGDTTPMEKYQRDFEERERIKEAYRRLKNEDVTDSFVCRSESPMSLVCDDDLGSANYVDEMMEVDEYPLHSSPGICDFSNTNCLQQSPHYYANTPTLYNVFQQHQTLQKYQEESSPHTPTDEEMPLVIVETVMDTGSCVSYVQTGCEDDANKRRKRGCYFDSSNVEDEVEEIYGNASKRVRFN